MSATHGNRLRSWWDAQMVKARKTLIDNVGVPVVIVVALWVPTWGVLSGVNRGVAWGVMGAQAVGVTAGVIVWNVKRWRYSTIDLGLGMWDRAWGRGKIRDRARYRRLLRRNSAEMLMMLVDDHTPKHRRRRHRARALRCVLAWCDKIDPGKADRFGVKRYALPRPTSVSRINGRGAAVELTLLFEAGKNALTDWRGVAEDIATCAGVEHRAVVVRAAGQANAITVELRCGAEFGVIHPEAVEGGSYRDGLYLGNDAAGQEIRSPARVHALIAGMTGSGKTTLLRWILDQITRWRDCGTILFDPHGDLSGYRRRIRRGLYVGPRETRQVVKVTDPETGEVVEKPLPRLILEAVDKVADERFDLLGDNEGDEIEFTRTFPIIIIVWDELARFTRSGPHAKWFHEWYVGALEQYRKVGIHVYSSTQHPTDAELPYAAKMMIGLTVALQLKTQAAGRVVMGEGVVDQHDPTKLPGDGHAWINLPKTGTWVRARCVMGAQRPEPPTREPEPAVLPPTLRAALAIEAEPHETGIDPDAWKRDAIDVTGTPVTSPPAEPAVSWGDVRDVTSTAGVGAGQMPGLPSPVAGTVWGPPGSSGWGPPSGPPVGGGPVPAGPAGVSAPAGAGGVAVAERAVRPLPTAQTDRWILDVVRQAGGTWYGQGKDLATAAGVDPSAVSKALSRLVRAGWVEETKLPDRRRKITVRD